MKNTTKGRKTISIQFPENVIKQIEDKAAHRHISVKGWCRYAILLYLRHTLK